MKYLISLLSVFLLVGFCTVSADAAARKPKRVVCQKRTAYDGYKLGFIWKPLAAHSPFASGVLTGDFLNNVKSVGTYTLTGKYIDELRIKASGNCRGLPECLFRPSFESSRYNGAAYRRSFGSILVRAFKRNGSCVEWLISNPSLRAD